MSGLLAEIHQHTEEKKNRCGVKRILDLLDKEDQADLDRAIKDVTISASAIARALAARGIDINPNGERIRLHRRGQCACARG